MKSKERIEAALRLAVPDRVPIFPLMVLFPARHAGIPMAQFLSDKESYYRATDQTFDDLGGWDGVMANGGIDYVSLAFLHTMKARFPGRDLSPEAIYQLVEEPILEVEDYDLLIREGWPALQTELLSRIRPELFPKGPSLREKVGVAQLTLLAELQKDITRWRNKGAEPLFGGITKGPVTRLSEFRSLEEFSLDLYRRPDQVSAALEVLTEGAIEEAKGMAAATGIPRIFIGEVRSGESFMSPRHFERFSLPFLKQIVDSLAAEGIFSILHLDSKWTRYLPYFLEFPQGRCAVMFDGQTDIFQAKEVLGNHLCILGDVPASLLVLGSLEEVREYTRRLIVEVGRGGGFILCTGCELPFNAREENVRAMLETAREYGGYV